MRMVAHLYVGTSGFAYTTWKPGFYPADVPSTRFLDYYSTRLNCVEVNYTFRRFASPKIQETWIARTPPDFLFCPKAHMRITHILRLKGAGEIATAFLEGLDPLGKAKRLGPVLFQLPPNLKCDPRTLSEFLEALPKQYLYAFEFRHPSWFDPEVYRVLENHKSAMCLAESEKLESPEVITANFAYFRLRKPVYSPEDHRSLAAKIKTLLAATKDVFVFFKHEDAPDGALNAVNLLEDVVGRASSRQADVLVGPKLR